MHKQHGSIKTHMEETHNTTLTRQHLVDNTTVIHSNHDPKRIEIIEVIYIRDFAPTINHQRNQRLEKLALWGTNNRHYTLDKHTTHMTLTIHDPLMKKTNISHTVERGNV